MRILVTGGTGFLGSAFVRTAAANGHPVAVLARSEPTAFKDLDIRWLSGSMADPPWDDIRAFAPDCCLHAAWIATPGVYLESPENRAWVEWSRDFLVRLADLGARRVTVLGTCIEYQITGQPLSEDETPIHPVSLYSRSKNQLHRVLRELFRPRGVSLTWARIFYPYGEGEHPARFASSVVSRIQAGENVFLKTPRSVKDYIHVSDVASALLKASEAWVDGAINIGTGEGVMIETMARQIAEQLGRPDLIQTPKEPVSDPLDFVVADATRLRGLGWRPQVGLEEGLRRLVEARCQ
jgi:dTDP-6-deoxy-L-talose 4-dehydrogenase (NAD+)